MPINYPITTVKGTPLPQNFRDIIKFDPQRGYNTTYDWAGADQELAAQLFNWYASQGIAVTLTLEADKATMTAVDSTSEYSIDSWEIVGTNDSPDLFAHPTLLNAIGTKVGFPTAVNLGGGLTTGSQVIKALRDGIQNNSDLYTLSQVPVILANFVSSSTPPTPGPPPVAGSVIWNAQGQILAEFYVLYTQGTTVYYNPQYSIRHKSNVSNRWLTNVADFGIDQIYTPAQLLTEVGDFSLWIFPMPYSMQYFISNIPIPMMGQMPTSTTGYQWGWLKSPSTRTTEALNRQNIETNYTLQLWNAAIYTPFTGIYGGGDS